MQALRGFDIPPGDYVVPCPGSMKELSSRAFIDRGERPRGIHDRREERHPAMGAQLVQWFLYCVVVGIFAAYIASAHWRRVRPTARLPVRRLHRLRRLLPGALAEHDLVQASLGRHAQEHDRRLIYGLLTAGTLGWLWPR